MNRIKQPASPHTERRAGGDRIATIRLATIRLDDGQEIPCVIRDLSPSGAKLAVSERHALPTHFGIIVQGRDRVFPVKRVWRRGDLIGVALVTAGPELSTAVEA